MPRSAERDVASTAHTGAESPLRLSRAARGRVVNRGQQIEDRTVSLARLEGERPLPRSGSHHVRRQRVREPVLDAEPSHAGCGDDDGVEVVRIESAQTRVHVPMELNDF